MAPEKELKIIRDEVHRKIGRNILFIQALELKLKKLIAANGLQINSSGDNLDQRFADVSNKTMGTLAGIFHKSYFDDHGEISKKEVESKESAFFSIRITGDVFSSHIKESLASIVDERNKLVHHFLEDLTVDIKAWEDADQSLEKQHANLVFGYKNLDKISELFKEGIAKLPF